MKKKYVKPVIIFESFKMDANIAGNCQKQENQFTQESCFAYVTMSDYNSCGYYTGIYERVLFGLGSDICNAYSAGEDGGCEWIFAGQYWNS